MELTPYQIVCPANFLIPLNAYDLIYIRIPDSWSAKVQNVLLIQSESLEVTMVDLFSKMFVL